MPEYKLKVQRNQLGYTGLYKRPMIEWLGTFVQPAQACLEAFEPFGFGLDSLHVTTGSQSVNQQGTQIFFGLQGNYSCKLDRNEAVFWNLDGPSILRATEILGAGDAALRKASPDLEIKSHQFVYSAHSTLEARTVAELLGQFGIPAPKSGGTHARTATIFYWDVLDKGWQTQLTLDASQIVLGGLFLSFSLSIAEDHIEFGKLFDQGREYLQSILQEINIDLPSEA